MATKTFDVSPYLLKGISYRAYIAVIKDLLNEGKTSGQNHSKENVELTQLNLHRMERLEKTVQIIPELVNQVKAIKQEQTWLCITEAWCGDSAQNIPLFYLLAQLNPLITFKLVFRDENLELMDQYLTNGGRGIPMVISFEQNKQVWKWGPRPLGAQAFVDEFKQNPIGTAADMKVRMHTWYAKNKTAELQNQLLKLI